MLDNTDKNGRPNGATHAAYVKLPTNFSRFLPRTCVNCKTSLIRFRYFLCFFTESLQDLAIASYKKPRISIIWAGGWHFVRFIFAPVRSPTAISYSNNFCALFLSYFVPELDFIGPPKMSSTYDANTKGMLNFSPNRFLKALH